MNSARLLNLLSLAAILAAGLLPYFGGQARAADPDASVRESLRSSRPPWYDSQQDGLKRLRMVPPKNDEPPPAPTPPVATTSSSGVSTGWWPVFEWLGLILILGIAAAIVVTLLYLYANRESDPASEAEAAPETVAGADRVENLPFAVARPRGDLLDEARLRYEQGDYNGAIVYLYSYQLIQLDKHQVIQLERGKTNRQYLRETRPRADLSPALQTTMVAFEDVFFGSHRLTRERFERCWSSVPVFQNLAPAA